MQQTLARAAIYRWCAAIARNDIERADEAQIASALRQLPELSFDVPPRPSALAAQYEQVFGHTLTPDAPPYETMYGTTHIFAQSQTLADLAGFYRAFGVTLSPRAHERADHVAVELEFMALLAHKEARALANHRPEPLVLCCEAQAKFLREHLGCWIEALAAGVERKAPQSFLAQAFALMARFISWDCARLGVTPQRLALGQLSEPDDEDTSCVPCFANNVPPPCAPT